MKPKLKIDWCSHEAALYSVQKWHYSKTLPRGKLVKLGVWEDDKFIGVVIFSMGASAHLHKKYGLKNVEFCELTRIALKEHQTPVSRIGSIAVMMLKKLCTILRLIVSFADPFQGHTGKIYQAMNWIYSGQSARASVWIDQRGKLWHNRHVADEECRGGDGWGTRMHSKKGMTKEIRDGKFRYLCPLYKDLRQQLESLRLEYPKCVASETG